MKQQDFHHRTATTPALSGYQCVTQLCGLPLHTEYWTWEHWLCSHRSAESSETELDPVAPLCQYC